MSSVSSPAIAPAVEYTHALPRQFSLARVGYRAVPYAALSAVVFLIHGYHPYSQDASIYVAEIEKAIDPSLFQVNAAFVTGQARFSLFPQFLSLPTRCLSIPLDFVLLAAYWATVVLFLVACHRLATRLFCSEWERWGAVVLASACFTLPVAGTSLLLMDPYVTARSFSTPLSILAVVACLDRSWKAMALWTALAIVLDPLMGIYLVCFLLILGLVQAGKEIAAIRVCAAAFIICGIIAWISTHSSVSLAYRAVIKTHGYFFLSQWHWYEVMGLIAPLILLSVAAERCGMRSMAGKLCATGVLVGITAYVSALCFVHEADPGILARIQILRSFHMIYCIGVVMLGGFLVRYFRSRGVWIALGGFVVAFAGMAVAEQQSYVQSPRIELPGQPTTNPWEQAFRWIRANTPQNAVFATGTSTFTRQDKDVQGFRAIAERSILNGAKDQSVAAVLPALAPAWLRYSKAEHGLNEISDSERVARLRRYGVTWLLLAPGANTAFSCPYRNSVVKVCRM